MEDMEIIGLLALGFLMVVFVLITFHVFSYWQLALVVCSFYFTGFVVGLVRHAVVRISFLFVLAGFMHFFLSGVSDYFLVGGGVFVWLVLGFNFEDMRKQIKGAYKY